MILPIIVIERFERFLYKEYKNFDSNVAIREKHGKLIKKNSNQRIGEKRYGESTNTSTHFRSLEPLTPVTVQETKIFRIREESY